MKKILGIALLLASFAGASRAQTTNVFGTILDPNNFPYSNAKINVILVPAPAGPATCGNQPLQPIPAFTADVNGKFNIGLCPNASISSGGVTGGSQWQFNVSISPGVPPPAGFGPQSFSIAVTISGSSQDVSSTLSAVAPVLARSTSAGGVTSVGLSMPSQYAVSGSPVIGTGTLGAQWLPVTQGVYLGGPTPNTVSGVFDGVVPGTSNASNSVTITATPTVPNDLAFFLSQAGPAGVCSAPVFMTGSGTWTNQLAASNNGALFTQQLTGTTPLTGTANCTSGGAAFWSGQLFFLTTSGTPVFRQTNTVTGGIHTGITLAFGSSVIGGHSILAIVEGIPSSAPPISGGITDTQGNVYTPLAIVQNGTDSIAMAFLAVNINTSGADTLTFTTNASFISSGVMYIAEITNLAAQNALPTFHPIPPQDLPFGTVTVTPPASGNSLTCFFFPPNGNIFPIQNCDLSGDVTTAGSPTATVHKINGVTISGTPTAGQVPTATSGSAASWQTPATSGTGVQVFQDTPMSSDVTVGTTNTTVLTQAITMPSSGCPCRVQYSFSLWPEFATFTNVPEVAAWITDGTTNFRGVQTGQSNASSGGRTSMTYTGWTTSTYANSASVTFTLLAIAQTGGGFVLKAAPEVGSSANAGMSFAVFTSN